MINNFKNIHFRNNEFHVLYYFNQTISRSNVHHYKITYGNLLHVKDFDSITLDDKVQIHFKKYDILSSQ